MVPKFKFQPIYFGLTILLFLIEVIIALYIQDDFIRPFFGDFLVVILLYCFIKSFFETPVGSTALFVLLFSYLVEFLQYLNFVEIIGLQENKLARIVMGTSFSWWDIIYYTLGILFVLIVEIARKRSRKMLLL